MFGMSSTSRDTLNGSVRLVTLRRDATFNKMPGRASCVWVEAIAADLQALAKTRLLGPPGHEFFEADQAIAVTVGELERQQTFILGQLLIQ
jgi:hypothetical protein